MAEVREFTLPDLGEGLTEATITTWMVEVGEVVAVDQPVVEVETAKAMVEVPCPYAGVVTARYGDEGDEVPVGTPLVTVAVGAGAEEAVGETDDRGSGNVLVGYGTRAPEGRRRGRVRAAPAQPPAPGRAAPGRSPDGAAEGPSLPDRAPAWEQAVRTPGTAPRGGEAATAPEQDGAGRGSGTVAVISPLVRRVAREHGIDLRQVTGSGPDGLILRGDVERAVRTGPAARQPEGRTAAHETWHGTATTATSPSAGARTTASARSESRIPLRGLRGTVADKLSRSRREIPDATTWVDADATELLAARRAMNAQPAAPKISLLALLARVCTAALARYPELNSTVDTEAREIVRLDAVHLGFAAQTDRGLVVPVVRDAHRMGAEELGAEMARLTEAARAGTLSPAELTGGTFTLNNYGVFGVDGSTPILNHPEAAMLGVGRIAEKPWAVDGELAVRRVVQLSFTFDHRVCDGGTAGGFLRYVADCVEQPAVLLRTL